LYGRSGTGKTTLAASWPKKLVLFDVNDKGTDSISDIHDDDIDIINVRSWDDFEAGYWYVYEKSKDYSTVIVDTVSQLQQILVYEMSKNKDKPGHWGTMTRQAWGDLTSKMKTWITYFRDLPMEVVFIAQDRVFSGDEESDDNHMIDPEVGPALSPSVAKHLNASAHVIVNTFIRRRIVKTKPIKGKSQKIEKIDYCLRVGPNPIYATKFRKPKSIILPSVLSNPDYDKIRSIMLPEKKE